MVGNIQYQCTISNCNNVGTIVANNGMAGGIAGYILNKAVISNCENTGEVSTPIHAGGITGYAYLNCIVKDSYNYGEITALTLYAGGIAGYIAENSQITDCTNNGSIEAYSKAGGIAGSAGKTEISGCLNSGELNAKNYFGGIAGELTQQSNIRNSHNSAAITGDAYLGGIAGNVDQSSSISDCSNSGNVTAFFSCSGGIAGGMVNSSAINSCYNTGEIRGSSLVGGIAGTVESTSVITDSYNSGSIMAQNSVGGIAGSILGNSEIINCYNDGRVEAELHYAGGIAGYNEHSAITNCYNSGPISGINYVGGIIGLHTNDYVRVENCYYLDTSAPFGTGSGTDYAKALTEAEMRQKESFKGWDFDSVWTMIPNDYPIFKWQTNFWTVTFVDRLGNVIATQTVRDGKSPVTPPIPVIPGYTFAGWDKDISRVTEDMTVRALYAEITYIVSIETVKLGSVLYDTPYSSLALPLTVKAITDNGEEIILTVVWNESDYSSKKQGTQTIYGTVNLPDGNYELMADVKAKAIVTVEPEDIVDPREIVSIENVTVYPKFYSEFKNLGLPAFVTATLSDGNTIMVPVVWNESDYNKELFETQTIGGKVKVPYGYYLRSDLLENVSATLEMKPMSINSVKDVYLGKLPVEVSVEDLGLPSTVIVYDTEGVEYSFPVIWNVDYFDSDTLGEGTISGNIVKPVDGVNYAPGKDGTCYAHYTITEKINSLADIVFVIDTTSSMQDEITNLKNYIEYFAQVLEKLGVSARFGLIEYKDITVPGEEGSTIVHLYDFGRWFTSAANYKVALESIIASGGGDAPETLIDALECGRLFDFRDGAGKFMIVVTDSAFKLDNNYGVASVEEAIARLLQKGIVVSVMTTTAQYGTYSDLTEQTRGILTNLYGTMPIELQKIANMIFNANLLRNLIGIEITEMSIKTEYKSGEYFDPAGMKVLLKLAGGATIETDAYTISILRPLKVSDTVITVSYGGYTAEVPITVTANTVPVSGIELNKSEITLEKGRTEKLTVVVTPFDATNREVIFITSNPNVATVDENGKIRAEGPGSAVITVMTKDGEFTATCTVTVTAPGVPVTGVSIDNSGIFLNFGKERQLMASVYPTNATNKGVIWESSDTSVATVDENGKVTAVGVGLAVITVTTVDGEYKAFCLVTVTVSETDPKLVIGDALAKMGDTITVQIAPANVPALKSLMLHNFVYDKTKLQLVDGTLRVADAVISNFDIETEEALLAFVDNSDINGVILELTFKVLVNEYYGDYPVSCTILAKQKDGTGTEVDVPIRVVDGKVTVMKPTRGDVNGDGKVDSDDSIYLLRYTLMPEMYPINQDGDMNGDGVVDSDDAIYLLRYTFLPTQYPLKNRE